MNQGAAAAAGSKGFRRDEVLVRECLLGNEQAWSDLIDKYKKLIFSIPVKYGLPPEDAADIFQAVSFTLLRELPRLREPQALAAWLIRLTVRSCSRWKHEQHTHAAVEIDEENLIETQDLPDALLEEIDREQACREALDELSSDCRRLVDFLFFTDPPMRYDDAARELQLAKGSIGATRMRCLDKLRDLLEKKGIR